MTVRPFHPELARGAHQEVLDEGEVGGSRIGRRGGHLPVHTLPVDGPGRVPMGLLEPGLHLREPVRIEGPGLRRPPEDPPEPPFSVVGLDPVAQGVGDENATPGVDAEHRIAVEPGGSADAPDASSFTGLPGQLAGEAPHGVARARERPRSEEGHPPMVHSIPPRTC